MLTRRIVGIAGISLWAGLIVVAAIAALENKKAEPVEQTAQELSDEHAIIETMAKDLVEALLEGDYERATENFDETMKKALPAAKLREVWNSIIAQMGPFVEQTGIRREKIQQYDVIFVTCKFEKGVLDTKVVFNSSKQVAGLFFVPGNKHQGDNL